MWCRKTGWEYTERWAEIQKTAMVPWLKRPPSEYVFDHVRLSTQPLEEPEDPAQILAIFDIIHAERTLCFASDFPHWDFDDPFMALPPSLSEAQRRGIYADNARALYRLG